MIKKKFMPALLCMSILSALFTLPVYSAKSPDTTTAQGWTAVFAGEVDAYIELDDKDPYAGEFSLKAVNNTPVKANTYLSLVTNINLVEGRTYEIGLAAKSQKSTTVQLTFNWDKRRNLLPFGGSYSWTESAIEYTATQTGPTEMRFVIDGVTEGFWLDEVYCREKGKDKNLIQNSGFELAPVEEEKPEEVLGEEVLGLEQTYYRIKQGTTFLQSDFERVRGGFKFMPIYRPTGITIDGNMDDWNEFSEIYMPTLPTQYQIYMEDQRELDATAKTKFAYDDVYFYLYLESHDDINFPVNESDQYWTGDSFQFTISRMDDTYGTEMGCCHNIEKDKTEIYSTALGAGGISQISAKSTYEDGVTKYEIRMPWEIFFNERYSRPEEFKIDVLYNDNDGDGRRYCVELAPGISEGKTNAKFPILSCMEDSSTWYTWIDGETTAPVGEDTELSLYLVNGGSIDGTYSVTFPDGTVEEHIIKPNTGERIPFNVKFTEEGVQIVQVQVSDSSSTYTASFEVTAAYTPPTPEEASKTLQTFESYAKELNELIAKCTKQGISTEYEQVNCSTIEKFIEYIKRDIERNDLSLFRYQHRCIEKLYVDAKADLEAYLTGQAEPLPVPEYITSELTTKNNAIWAMTDTDGVREERPVFFVGYGHFADASNQIPTFNKFGVNTIQTEIGPSSVISSNKAPTEWTYFLRGVNATCSVQSEVAKDGKYALKFTNTDPYTANNYMAISQTVSVEPNTIYKIGGWVKVESADRFYIYTDGYNGHHDFGKTGGYTHDWQEWELTFTTGENQTTRNIRILSNGVTKAGYLDGLYIKKEGSDENLLLNGSFEQVNSEDTFFNVTTSAIKGVESILLNAEKNNINVCLLLSPHYFPSFVLEMYPEINYNLSYGFIKYNIMDERAKQVIEAYLRAIIPRIKDYTSLGSLCVSNEPQFWTKQARDFYQPLWEEYIKEKHGTIEALNVAYGTEYADFSECKIPTVGDNLALYYDYKLFNDKNFSSWHKFMSDIIKEIAPDIPLHAKIMEFPGTTSGTTSLMVQDGTKLENYIGVLDWNGCDGANRYENNDSVGPLVESFWYDYQRSIQNAPVINTEDHIHVNGSKIYTDEINDYAIQAMWEGAIHGRSYSDIWLWERHDGSNPSQSFRGNISYRPDTLAGIGRATHDMNRLSYELVALQDEKADVALLYSDATAIYAKEFGNSVLQAYTGVMYAGKKALIVTEDLIEKLAHYKALIIPRVLNAKESTVNAVAEFIRNGGKVFIIDENSLRYSEYGKPHNSEVLEYIYSNSEVVRDVTFANTTFETPTKEELFVLISDFIGKCGLDYITAVNAETGELAGQVVLDSAIYDGKLIVNVCNYAETKDIKIKVGDKIVSESFDLIKYEDVPESFTAKRYVSKLLVIDTDHNFIDVFGHWAEENISSLAGKGLVKGMSESRFEPENKLTRAEFLTMLVRAAELENAVYSGGISDVSAKDWYADYVASAQKAGIITEGTFRPNDKITREEMCVMLTAFYENKNDAITGKTADFSDIGEAGDREAVEKAFAKGFINGYEDGTFRPQSNMTRAEASTVVIRFMEN